MQSLNSDQLEVLLQAGLSPNELEVFQVVLSGGKITAREISRQVAKINRPNVYKVLSELQKKKLVRKTSKGKINAFQISDPYHFRDLLAEKRRKLAETTDRIEQVLPEIMSMYHFTTDRPSVRYYQGADGLELIYQELNHSGEKELLLIRSVYDDDHPELSKIINRQIGIQIKLGIRAKVLTPLVPESKMTFINLDKERLVERRIVERKRLILPAQVLIWGDTTAIISMKNKIIGSVIENKEIAETFRTIFKFIWDSSEDYHQRIVESWRANPADQDSR